MFDRLLRQLLPLAEPVGFVWVCLIALALVCLLLRRWKTALSASLIAVLIFVFGASDLPGALLRSLESRYANNDWRAAPAADAVVMLGGGIEPSRLEVGGFHLTRAGDRLLMAVEMMRLGKAPVLVLGGGGASRDEEIRAEADLVQEWIRDWKLLESAGQAPPEVISLGRCRDTHDEALKVREIADQRGWERVLLVTSAAHMRRAEATFRTAGVNVVPVACNFLTTVSTTPPKAGFSFPHYAGFEKISIWMHEQIGWLEYRRRGWINPSSSFSSSSSHPLPQAAGG